MGDKVELKREKKSVDRIDTHELSCCLQIHCFQRFLKDGLEHDEASIMGLCAVKCRIHSGGV